MNGKTGNYILIGMVLGATLGTLGGYFLGDIFIEIKFLGTIFLNALKMVVIPLIVASIIVGVSSLGDIRKLGRTSAIRIPSISGSPRYLAKLRFNGWDIMPSQPR